MIKLRTLRWDHPDFRVALNLMTNVFVNTVKEIKETDNPSGENVGMHGKREAEIEVMFPWSKKREEPPHTSRGKKGVLLKTFGRNMTTK